MISRRKLLELALVSPFAAALSRADDSRVKIERRWKGSICESQITNHGNEPVKLNEVVLFDLQLTFPPTTKLYGEGLMRAYSRSYGLDTASLRYFNIFGPRQTPDSAYAAAIAAFAKAMIGGRRPTIYGDGEQSRDFTFVHNAVHANLLAARREQPIRGQVFNVGCGQRVSLNVLFRLMAELLGTPQLTPTYGPDRAGDVKHSLADISCAREVLGYEPIVDFRDGLAATTAWYRDALA